MEDGKLPTSLLPLMRACDTLACSSAECERGFSLLNLILTPLRNQLLIENVAYLMFVNLNGPPVNIWNARPYVKTWITSGHSLDQQLTKEQKFARKIKQIKMKKRVSGNFSKHYVSLNPIIIHHSDKDGVYTGTLSLRPIQYKWIYYK